ncbi:2-oxoglutarate (2OG) and Fe(II)-dependent oxygenase superfamily protein [Actinidia rufa]|uniref:2-oxoglutarate (2OG) and Fe(II)-dependent oxygenase superfamily protein n=1 Tax=Actinidia rufa TaxID=165716 RepID=A0A7J0EVR9_9ERIC|nr:2-oxoglutarate (2OG) and Fe(II)-dependent oxygenase superfamily protein [Actinidia rufa]
MEISVKSLVPAPKPASVKALLESSIPCGYSNSAVLNLNEHDNIASETEESIPIIDFSLLTSSDPIRRSEAIHQLSHACQEWGFFMLVNHGVPESLMKAVINGCDEIFNMSLEEKETYESHDIWAPIRYNTGSNGAKSVSMWRETLRVLMHRPYSFPSELKAVSLGLEEFYIDKAMDLESGYELFVANFYPSYPQPELAMGIPPHTDCGLLTALIHNGVVGLEIQHRGKWLHVKPLPNAILIINVADQLEILSNGICKSVFHRALVNSSVTRMSVVMAYGPLHDKVVGPAPELIDIQGRPPAFTPMEFKKYMDLKQTKIAGAPPLLDQRRIRTV